MTTSMIKMTGKNCNIHNVEILKLSSTNTHVNPYDSVLNEKDCRLKTIYVNVAFKFVMHGIVNI